MTDKEYIIAFKQDDNAAISAFYRKYESKLKSELLHWFGLNDEDFVAEVFQEAIVRLWENIKSGRLTVDNLTTSLTAYLFYIGKNVGLEILRREDKYVSTDIEGEEDWDANEMLDLSHYVEIADSEEPELVKAIREVVDNLGAPCNPLLLSFYWDKKSWEEIAAELGYSNANSAKTQKNKCMNKIKAIFRKS